MRSVADSRAAIAGGADWIDVKEPAHGALGRATAETIAAVVRTVAGRRPISVALGELIDLPPAGAFNAECLAGVKLAKVGLAGCNGRNDWPEQLHRLAQRLPPPTGLVAVHYADAERCGGPSIDLLLAVGRRLGLSAMLVDTYFKDRGALLDLLHPAELARLFTAARAVGMLCVAAGSLQAASFTTVCEARPDLVAVRGAACRGGDRLAAVSSTRVAMLKTLLSSDKPRIS